MRFGVEQYNEIFHNNNLAPEDVGPKLAFHDSLTLHTGASTRNIVDFRGWMDRQ